MRQWGMSWAARGRRFRRWLVNTRSLTIWAAGVSTAILVAGICGATAALANPGPAAGPNVRVTVDQASTYVSADQLAGGSYTDRVLSRCGADPRNPYQPSHRTQ